MYPKMACAAGLAIALGIGNDGVQRCGVSQRIKDTAASMERKSVRSQLIGVQERPAAAQAARASSIVRARP